MNNKAEYKRQVQFRTSEDNNNRIIEGYFAVFEEETELFKGFFEKISKGAFKNTLEKDNIRCLFNHNTDIVLGTTDNNTLILKEDDKGLYGKVIINDKDTEAINIYERVKRGDITGCSFGFFLLDFEEETDDKGRHTKILEAQLLEVSICTYPAYESTNISARNKQYDYISGKKLNNKKDNIRKKLERLCKNA